MNKVLLVDDEIHILRAAEFKLKRSGFDVSTAFDGEKAWEVIGQDMPDLVVTDVQMPRLSGIELVRRLRENPQTEHLPVIMLTAKGFELPRQELIAELRIIDIVAKPFSPRDLCRRVEAALQELAEAEAEQAPE